MLYMSGEGIVLVCSTYFFDKWCTGKNNDPV